MADSKKQLVVKLSAEGVQQIVDAFTKVGKASKDLETKTGSLGSAMKTLAGYAATYFAASKFISFLKDSTKEAIEQEKATGLLIGRVEQVGLKYQDAKKEIDKFVLSMQAMGRVDEDTQDSIGRLILQTKNVEQAIKLTKLASDLAASGYGTMAENADNLQKVLSGRGAFALRAYRLEAIENATVMEQLAAIQGRVTLTTEQWAQSTAGSMATLEATWKQFKENVGNIILPALKTITQELNTMGDAVTNTSVTWTQMMGEKFNSLVLKAQTVFHQLLKPIEGGDIIGSFKKVLEDIKVDFQTIDKLQEDHFKIIEKGSTAASEATKGATDDLGEYADTADKAGDDIKNAFKDISKSIVQAFNDQEKAIKDLREEMGKLDDDLNADISKSNEKYQEDVKNLARKAQDHIDTINKQIADEQSSENAGWRTRIEQLQAEKAKEQAIINKAGGVVTDIQTAIAQDEFEILRESHNKELNEIQTTADKKKVELDAEIKARTDYLNNIQKMVTAPGFYGSATGQGTSFLGAIGAAPVQQSLVFNFNGGVAGDAGIKKIITDTIAELNRQATLRGVSGK